MDKEQRDAIIDWYIGLGDVFQAMGKHMVEMIAAITSPLWVWFFIKTRLDERHEEE